MDLTDLRAWNEMERSTLLRPGDRIEIRAGPESPVHTVQAGDTLSEIAERYGIRTVDLVRWNGNPLPFDLAPRVHGEDGPSIEVSSSLH